MTIQELEQQLLSLDRAEQLRIIQLLSQNISQTPQTSVASDRRRGCLDFARQCSNDSEKGDRTPA
ncbi:MAG: hypothetical protein LH679_16210 [Cyanobacteria bacterium CAN_BIN43]|nr:hypothetical protein [Cyanobacteria bacterium CAN_BIN43]